MREYSVFCKNSKLGTYILPHSLNIIITIGELCGECRGGNGVSAILNRCTTCSDASGLLILLLSKTETLVTYHMHRHCIGTIIMSENPLLCSGGRRRSIRFPFGGHETISNMDLSIRVLPTGNILARFLVLPYD